MSEHVEYTCEFTPYETNLLSEFDLWDQYYRLGSEQKKKRLIAYAKELDAKQKATIQKRSYRR